MKPQKRSIHTKTSVKQASWGRIKIILKTPGWKGGNGYPNRDDTTMHALPVVKCRVFDLRGRRETSYRKKKKGLSPPFP
jgi:hypothetical protein